MQVYRITLAKWSGELIASGNPARWNSKGKYVIYTAASRALACLENVVHRSGEGLSSNYKVLTVEIPSKIKMAEIDPANLPDGWQHWTNYYKCQAFGDQWCNQNQTAVLKVPSAIIIEESNYLINPTHDDFLKIKIVDRTDFLFDHRLLL